MATKVIMPKAGMAMEEGVIVSWLKKPGDRVRVGEPIAEIETDKAVMELEAEESGILLSLVHQVGDHVAVTETIAWIGEAGEQAPTTEAKALNPADTQAFAVPPETVAATSAGRQSRQPATPAARHLAKEAGIKLEDLPLPESGAVHAEDVRRHIRREATPLASRIAEAAGIDPSSLTPSANGRARKADVLAAVATRTDLPGFDEAGADRRVPFTAIQRITGDRLAKSHAEIPSVTVFTVANATDFLAARDSLNASGLLRVSVNDLAVMASAKALRANPRANAIVEGDALILKGEVNIGIAVATEAGLLVPTLRRADRLPLGELARFSKDLADRARSRRLRPEELENGTFTVSNIGMYGVTSFTPIINQPQVGILGVGAVEERLTLDAEGRPVIWKALHLSFTFDHRALDGAEASSFIKSVKDLIERPLLILV